MPNEIMLDDCTKCTCPVGNLWLALRQLEADLSVRLPCDSAEPSFGVPGCVRMQPGVNMSASFPCGPAESSLGGGADAQEHEVALSAAFPCDPRKSDLDVPGRTLPLSTAANEALM